MANLSTDEALAASESANLRSGVFAGDGEMGELMRAVDWSATPLGPVESWPQSLRISVRILLGSGYPMLICWGPQFTMLYNDAYRPILGRTKHPGALGSSCRNVFAEYWAFIGPLFERVMSRGEDASTLTDQIFLLDRNGYLEECYFTFSYSPIPNDAGEVGGVFVTALETTDRVIGDRGRLTLRDLASSIAGARTVDEVCRTAVATIQKNRYLASFLMLYLYQPGSRAARLAASSGGMDSILCPEWVRPGVSPPWPLLHALRSGNPEVVTGLEEGFYQVPLSVWGAPTDSAAVIPARLRDAGEPIGFLVVGLNPRREFDDAYRQTLLSLADQIAMGIAGARAYEHERRRAEELAEVDRAKTAFFTNISHEFRTPLTLMLGPLDEFLAAAPRRFSPDECHQLAMVRRNTLRLLKLVNTLLDFSRVEAGRAQAAYEPTDLAAFTAEVASVFRSTMEKAGLRFTVRCGPIAGPVNVDREMWEKIVLNLLSNAFKFTLEGSVSIELTQRDSSVELTVRDTGAGIPETELPHLFERFHRIETARARTHEGTGIGLALVQELARLHDGSVRVQSAPGKGSAFTVAIPLGPGHLPPENIPKSATAQSAVPRESYIEEAERWLPHEFFASPGVESPPRFPALASLAAGELAQQRDSILIADDNLDMRDYLARLLRPLYDVHAVSGGVEALALARRIKPSLVLADVMMPGMDGFELVRALRADPDLDSTPVVLLSARAGQESRVEGMEHGADDYLEKPFTARELLARLAAHIRLARIRREKSEMESRLRAQAELERRRLRELLTTVPAAIGLLHGPEHRWTFVNDFYVRCTGRNSPQDFLGKTVRESLPELEGQRYFTLLDDVYRTGTPYVGREASVRLIRQPGGQPFDACFDFIYQPIWDALGNVEGILVHAIDLTEHVATRRLLEESHARLKGAHILSQRLAAIVESSDDAIVSKDLNGIVTSWNSGAARLFGYEPDEIVGRSILTIIPPELHSEEPQILENLRNGRKIDHYETERVRKDGSRVKVSLTISPMRDAEGRVVGASKIARDITERVRMQEAIVQSEKLAATGRMAAAIAHEINNPLEAVTNLAYLLSTDPTLSAPGKRHAEMLLDEISRVSNVAKQSLGFFRDSGKPSRFDACQLLDGVVSLNKPILDRKKIEIVRDYQGECQVFGSAAELRQVLANLFRNATDAVGEQGSIRLRVRKSRSGMQRILIADNGPGIPPETRRRLFQPFVTTKGASGNGLGLWVSRGIVSKHGGKLLVRTRTDPHNSGTVFVIVMPTDEDAIPPSPQVKAV